MNFKKITTASLTGIIALQMAIPVLAATATDTVIINQVVTSGITISAPADITLTPLSVSQNSAVGSATWTVTTNNAAGYNLSVNATSTPALSGTSGSFTDQGTTPATWTVANAYKFGFSVLGNDVNTGTFGTDADCIAAADVPSATLNWRGFTGTSAIAVAASTTPTTFAGTPTTMCVATEQQGIFAPSGTYSATVVATAITN
jgi:hypothetical protein